MATVILDRGRQYVVNEGSSLLVDLIPDAEPGSDHVFDKVLAVDDTFGAPLVKGASVKAKVVGTERGRKLHVSKFKRRKDYRRRNGHRQHYTRLTIESISS